MLIGLCHLIRGTFYSSYVKKINTLFRTRARGDYSDFGPSRVSRALRETTTRVISYVIFLSGGESLPLRIEIYINVSGYPASNRSRSIRAGK